MENYLYFSPIPNNNFAFKDKLRLICGTKKYIKSKNVCPLCQYKFKLLRLHIVKSVNPSHILIYSAMNPKTTLRNGIRLHDFVNLLKIDGEMCEIEIVPHRKNIMKLPQDMHSKLLKDAQRKALDLALSFSVSKLCERNQNVE